MLSDGREEESKIQNSEKNKNLESAAHNEGLLGDKLPRGPRIVEGFELVAKEAAPDYHAVASEYRHLKTGARVFHLDSPDENKVFAIGFSTPALDSMGAAHIVEHSVLAGSQSFNVKDPFSVLARGSFQTFLNAFTGPSETVYPVASTNEAELLNLSKVYLDAVFKPILSLDTFRREGWRLEVDPDTGKIGFSGVVYNEMKEASASFNSALFRNVFKGLFPDSAFAHEHGGAPSEIPKLSYEAFKEFHKSRYVPSNSTTVIYGKLSPENHLRMLDEYFSGFDAAKPILTSGSREAISSPISMTAPYAVEEGADVEKDRALVLAWALKTEPNQYKFAPILLTELIAGGPGSALKAALDDAGIRGVLSAKLDLEGPGSDFALIMLRGLASHEVDKAEAVILKTLEKFSSEKIPGSLVDKAAFGLSCSLAADAERADRGVDIANEIIGRSLNSQPPLFCAAPASKVDEFAAQAKSERILESYIERNILKNPARLKLTLVPDPDAQARELAKEESLLAAAIKDLGPADIAKIQAENQAREAKDLEPDSHEASASIPRVKLGDVAPQDLRVKSESRAEAVFHELKPDSLVHASALFELSPASTKNLVRLPFLTEALLGVGTAEENYRERWNRLEGLLGDMDCGIVASTSRLSDETKLFLTLDAETTAVTAKNIWPVFKEVALQSDFSDVERLRKIADNSLIRFETAVRKKPNAFAEMRVSAALSEAGAVYETLQGLSQLEFMRELVQTLKDDPKRAADILSALRDSAFTRDGALVSVGAARDLWPALESGAADLLSAFGSRGSMREESRAPASPAQKEMIIGSNDINHVYIGASLPHTLNPAHCKIASEILTNLWVLPEIRLVGGAYGAGVEITSRRTDGESQIMLSSYRDPNPLRSIDKLLQAGEALRSIKASDMDLEDAAKSVLSRLYYPLDQGDRAARGKLDFICPGRAEGRELLRDEILKGEPIDFAEIARAVDEALRNPRIAIVASKQTAKKILKDGSWSTLRPFA